MITWREKLGKYWSYCTRNCGITNAYILKSNALFRNDDFYYNYAFQIKLSLTTKV